MESIPWFGDNFTGSEVSFTKSTWRLQQKISENAYHETEEDATELELVSEARAVFLCSRAEGLVQQEAVIKIRMQIPNIGTETKSTSERAKQARTILGPETQNEIKALHILTQAACSSSPTLLAWKEEKQTPNMWLPGGYIVHILMNKLPGIRIDFVDFLSRQERDELRESFKDAWNECRACGIVNFDGGLRNIIWDRNSKKCYIVDFEKWSYAEDSPTWHEGLFISWHLLICHPSGQYER